MAGLSAVSAMRDRELLRKAYPLMSATLVKHEHIMPRTELERLYGKEAIDLAIADGLVRPITVVRVDRSHKLPNQSIPAIATKQYDERHRPSWVQ